MIIILFSTKPWLLKQEFEVVLWQDWYRWNNKNVSTPSSEMHETCIALVRTCLKNSSTRRSVQRLCSDQFFVGWLMSAQWTSIDNAFDLSILKSMAHTKSTISFATATSQLKMYILSASQVIMIAVSASTIFSAFLQHKEQSQYLFLTKHSQASCISFNFGEFATNIHFLFARRSWRPSIS